MQRRFPRRSFALPSFAFASIAAVMSCGYAVADAASPYAGSETRGIKALSPQEVDDYRSGEGMGFAKAAELNGYPGPAHVLELADQLQLSEAQREKTTEIFRRMQSRASTLGVRLVDEEKKLDQLFSSRSISSDNLDMTLDSIAKLQSEIRRTHLQAHLEQAQVLSDAQSRKYWHLRGYAAAAPTMHHAH
jgi:hypothetical protein